MRTPSVLLLLFVLGAAVPASAQETDGDGEASIPEPSRSWAEWSRAFAHQLLASGRRLEAAEEMFAASLLDTAEMDLLCDAAVIVVEDGSRMPGGIGKDTPYEIFASQCIALAIRRGAGPVKPPEDAVPGPDGALPEERPGDPRVAYAIGRLAWAAEEYSKACAMFQEAFDGGFDRPRALDWYFRGAVNAAPTRYVSGMLDEGIADLERVLTLAPRHPQRTGALVNLADGFRRRQDSLPAQAILEELLAANPDAGEVLYTYALVLRDQSRLEECADALRRSVDALARAGEPFTNPLLDRVEVLQKLERLDEAEREIRRFLVLEEDEPEALYRLSRIRRDAGDLEEAIRLARQVVRLDRTSPRFLENLITLLHRRSATGDDAERAVATERLDRLMAELAGDTEGEPERQPDVPAETPSPVEPGSDEAGSERRPGEPDAED